MSAVEATQFRVAQPQRAALRLIGSAMVAFGVFLAGFVINEPAPYELWMAGLVGIWFILGLRISRYTAVLLTLLLTFNVGGMLSLTQMKDMTGGPMYVAVSTFLALTSVFYAAIIEDSAKRLPLMFNAWVFAAVITSLLGILGYFHAFPGAEVFTLYDRAKGAFQDPNVFGPFLVAPSLYLIHGILTRDLKTSPLRAAALLILALGVFLSFSRAAWGLFLLAVALLIFMMLLKERSGAFRLRILVLSLMAMVLMVSALLIALQFPQVSDLFSARAQLVQEYDGAYLGRFDRHRIGFQMMMERPLGIGPMVFGTIFPEDEHNIWLKTLTTYGWLGFVSYVSMLVWTLCLGFKSLLRDRPWQPYLMIAWICIIGHAAVGNVIDIDHWRHVYLLLGIVWGCAALEHRHRQNFTAPGAA
ncbi:O-antigen ligase family protein [Rhizobium sullae]|uniref:O-antigen ligase domain-containing protein n=1 Tax=Rhizobium sullae TaxID=50338 RepID=A0A2N0D4U8_RHISU|nr:O-antigen ligase family protein [Rhizobium sullae]PKA41123.1 O-antigen ligase domain-containing protein [Rhizobium sullae]UWU12682.1 O-antigen ligase family protein [Rhizobium sullae]